MLILVEAPSQDLYKLKILIYVFVDTSSQSVVEMNK